MKRSVPALLVILFMLSFEVSAQSPGAPEGFARSKSRPMQVERAIGNNNDKGVMSEFRSLEEEIKSKRRSQRSLKSTLETNLVRAVSDAINRRFYPQRETIKKDLTAENISYDNPTSPMIYYVKYETANYLIIVRCDYARDPARYYQDPVSMKLLVREPTKKG